MKRITVLLFLMLPLFAAAQIAVADFSINLRDQDANNEATKVIDDNGDVCALIKIETTQKGFSFDGGTVGVAKVDDSQVGEIWVWVPAGLRRLTIKHQQLGVLRDYYFPMQLQKGRTYIMKLVTGSVETVVQQKSSTQWLVLNFEPKDAMVEVDGDIVDCSNGIYKKMLPIGEHNVRVSARNYHTDAAKVMLTESETGKLTISLKPAFGWIEITGPSGATVFIDNGKIGEAPVKSRPLPSGKHDVRVTKENWLPYREQVLVNDNTVTTVSPQLTANFVTVTLKTGNNGEIWVNGEKRGEGSVSVDLSPGEYTFESRKASHRPQSIARTITLSYSGTIEIPSPVAIVGNLSVDVEPVGAKIYIDGTYAGESPMMRNGILVGKHTIKASYGNLQDEVKNVDIEEGKTSEVSMTLSKPKPTGKTLERVPKDFKGHYTIGNDVTIIGDSAFKNCLHLTGVTIPDGVTSIGEFAFFGCWDLKSVTIPDGVTSIEKQAFFYCTGLKSVTIPNSVTSIREAAFSYCYDLTSVTIPNSVTSIGGSAFAHCFNLTSVTIPNSVTSIGMYAFIYCTGLTSVTIPNSVTSIGYCAFQGCEGLTSVTIPDSVTSIEKKAFKGCKKLIIYVPKGTKKKFKAMIPSSHVKKIVER